MKRLLPNMFLLLLPSLFWGFTVQAQKTNTDTLKNYKLAKNVDLDTTISYQAQIKLIDIKTKTTKLIGQAEVVYENIKLNAGKITIDWENNLLTAEPNFDSTATGEDGKVKIDSATVGYPTVDEGGQVMVGDMLFYNFETKKARIIRGRTQYQEGYYGGNQIKKINEKVYYVKGGLFTTCDADTPHFYFAIDKMKMIYQDRVIAKPIIFNIHGIPIAALPFAVLPNRQGRHSGILVPRYGQSSVEGRYLRGLGYYWAASEYWDTKLEMDFFEKTGFMFHNTTNYAVRYLLKGSISGSLLRKNFDGQKQGRWDVAFNHNQTISPTMSLYAYGSFVSDGSYYNDFSGNRTQRLQREIRSNATLTKSWPTSKNSVSVNMSRSQYLDTESVRETLPQINFRHGQEPLVNLFRSRKKKSSSLDRPWYENIYFSYNSQLLNTRSNTRSSKESPFIKTKFFGVNHRISMSSPFKLFRYFTFNQSLNYVEIWQDRSKDYFLNEETNQVESRDKKGFATRRTFNTSMSMNTKIYGIFNVNRWNIIGFRHVITPNVSFNYQPDFSDTDFGYYQEIADTTGRKFKKDRFSGSRFGSTPSFAQRSISFSINNIFQMKRLVNDKEKKTDLFTFNLFSNYNFELDSLRLSRLNSSLRASPSRLLNFTVNFGHSFYKYDKTSGREVNRFLFNENPWSPLRLTNISVSSSLRLDQNILNFGGKSKKTTQTESDSISGEFTNRTDEDLNFRNRFDRNDKWATQNIPWNANLSFNYSEQRFNPQRITKTMWLNFDGNIRLTPKWRIQYNARLDLEKKVVVSQDFRIYRDLHCWEASFTWTPTGPYKRFYLRINIKSSILKDIKLEKRGGRGSIFGY